MLYCANCKALVDGKRCPTCKSDVLREPKADDFCLLTECDEATATLCRELFAEGDIPCVPVPATTPVRTVLGMFMQSFRLFVPFASLEEASAVLAAFTEGEAEAADTDAK